MVAASSAQADYDPSQYPAYETCALCHGLFGVSHTAKFPNLGGQRPAYIEAQLRAFLSGARSNDGGQMSAIVTELHELDIPLVVEWFSTQDVPQPYPAEGPTAAGAAAFTDLGCAGCHTNTAEAAPEVPYLSSQHPGYLLKQMADFRDGRRQAINAEAVHQSALSLEDQALKEIAAYLGALERP
jgi:cytochrome c553